MKVVFFGTPEYAVPSLQAIIDSRHQVVAVVSQPDKPKGRSNKLVPTPVKAKALEYNIPVYQFEKIRKEDKNNGNFCTCSTARTGAQEG